MVGGENGRLALDVLEYNEMVWTREEFIFGAPTSAMDLGQLAKYGAALREPYLCAFWRWGDGS